MRATIHARSLKKKSPADDCAGFPRGESKCNFLGIIVCDSTGETTLFLYLCVFTETKLLQASILSHNHYHITTNKRKILEAQPQ